jgi:hypothetical protein
VPFRYSDCKAGCGLLDLEEARRQPTGFEGPKTARNCLFMTILVNKLIVFNGLQHKAKG